VHRSAAVLALAVALLHGASALAECGVSLLGLNALTTELPAGGAPVVALFTHGGRNRTTAAPEIVLADGTHVAVRSEPLAPGLFRLVPATPLPPGSHRIENLQWPAAITVTAAAIPAGLAAPAIRSVALGALPGREGEPARTRVIVALSAPSPGGAIAIVLRSASGRAATWDQVASPSLELDAHDAPGRCAATVPGRLPPIAGEVVQLAWIDRVGRLSPWSAPVAVSAGR
jgi:hypothetical protein